MSRSITIESLGTLYRDYLAITSGRETHDPAVGLSARLAWAGVPVDEIKRLIADALPANYKGNTLDELDAIVRSAAELVEAKRGGTAPRGNSKKKSKAHVLASMVEDGPYELFHDQSKRAFLAVREPAGGVRTYLLGSTAADLVLHGLYYGARGEPLPERAINDAVNALKARAIFGRPERTVFNRIARLGDTLEIDLGDDAGRVVRIGIDGVEVTSAATARFYRPPGMKALAPPGARGGLPKLQKLLGVTDDTFLLIVAFLLACLRGTKPFMCLLIEGVQGSGKSYICDVIKRIIDPNELERGLLPESEVDIMLHAKEFFLVAYDNASGMKTDQSNVLCVIATGGGYGTRALYTNGELFTINVARPFVINGIGEFANRPDLLERSITIQLPPMAEEERKPESEMNLELESILPDVLADLYAAASTALANEHEIKLVRVIRMVDIARWLTAAAPALGFAPGTLVAALSGSQTDAIKDRVANDPVFVAIRNVLHASRPQGAYQGTMSELLQKIATWRGQVDKYFPTTASHLSRRIQVLIPGMKMIGIHVEWDRRRNNERRLRIWADPDFVWGQPPPHY
jgi:hypothetical protein